MYRQDRKLAALLEPAVTAMGYERLGLERWNQGEETKLRVYVDRRDGGVTINDCERVTDQISGILDVNDPIRNRYSLEVSSPGLDRPLFTIAQCARFVGRQVRIRTREKIAGRCRFTGALEEAGEAQLRIRTETGEYAIPEALIERARLVPEWSAAR